MVSYWDIEDRRLITTFGGPPDGITDLALSPDGRTLAVGSEDDQIWVWSLDPAVWVEQACLVAGRHAGEGPPAECGRLLAEPGR